MSVDGPAGGGSGSRRALPEIVLASASPRRTELLRGLGLQHTVDPSSIDELVGHGESAGQLVARLAAEKVRSVQARHPDSWVSGGDTEVVLDGTTLGKPSDPEDARRMLSRLSGRAHLVLSAVALARPGREPDVEVVTTEVHIRPLDRRTIDGYVSTGEPLDKAGAYGIQGLGSTLVDRIVGDYTAVVGLPVGALVRLLERAGLVFTFADGWRAGAEASDPVLDEETEG